MDKLVTLTREELYKMVWAEPIFRLAKKYSLSDYRLRQLCIRLSIPIPRPSHWKKIRAEQAFDIPPLSEKYNGDPTVQLTVQSPSTMTIESPVTKDTENTLIASARKNLRGTKKDQLHKGLAWTDGGHLRIGVAPANIDRACAFMTELLRTLDSRGYTISVKDYQTMIGIGEQPLPIVLRERTKRIYINDTRYLYGNSEMVPSGVLMLQMVYQYKEREWKIGDATFPEEAARIVENLEAASRRVDEDHRKMVRGWAEMDERQRIEKEIKGRRQAELTGFHSLIKAANRWHQAMFMRDYLTAVEKHHLSNGELTPDRQAWFIWARAKADWYDPLIEAPDEWLDNLNRDSLTN